ncbi:hypothetical protein MTO96_016888 [Rhipicephalus appendiculatus]
MEEAYEAVCTEGNELNELFYKGVDCLNEHGNQLHHCMNRMRNEMEIGVVAAPRKQVIHYSCCAFNKVQDCFDDALLHCPNTAAKEFMTTVLGQSSRGSLQSRVRQILEGIRRLQGAARTGGPRTPVILAAETFSSWPYKTLPSSAQGGS